MRFIPGNFAMQIGFLGHASLLLTAGDGTTLLLDPYNAGGFEGRLAYAPIPHRADFVVCSHSHVDHCAIDTLPSPRPQVIEQGVAGPFRVSRLPVAHDEYGGRRRGGSVDIVRIDVDGLVLVHLSDVGQSPESAIIEALGLIDVLFVPVGGFFTIGAAQADEWSRRLQPAQIVPIHYASARCTLPIRPVDAFLAYGLPARFEPSGMIEITQGLLSFSKQVVVLAPQL
ncbi:MAG: MBL fold metallo-hydrolase [Bradymonadaceae bacterium]|nr:MBL fold metallo-hydrolase [Lujinxingiaceae bacterium]